MKKCSFTGFLIFIFSFTLLNSFVAKSQKESSILSALSLPVVFKGNGKTAYRDPAILYLDKNFYLFFALVRTEDSGKVYSYTAMSTSKDLQKWSPAKTITPRDQSLDYSSPGDLVHYKNEWILCLQTYPRPE